MRRPKQAKSQRVSLTKQLAQANQRIRELEARQHHDREIINQAVALRQAAEASLLAERETSKRLREAFTARVDTNGVVYTVKAMVTTEAVRGVPDRASLIHTVADALATEMANKFTDVDTGEALPSHTRRTLIADNRARRALQVQS